MHTKYFKNRSLQHEVPEAEAKFAQSTVRNSDGSVTTEVKNIKNDEVISTETHKGDEPTGIWRDKRRSKFQVLDYSFNLVYADKPCLDTIAGLKNYWEDNDSLKYQAPKISNQEQTHLELMAKNTIYPDAARERDIEGKVIMTLRIGANGSIENIVVKNGVHVILDKEAVRVMRILKLSSPPMLDGNPVAICITIPLAFKLE